MNQFELWRRTLADQSDDLDPQREILRQAYWGFRDRTAQLVGEIGGLLPELTVHDITHIDALWRIAGEISGSSYPLNPAEAFVLGGAFLLHDCAHVIAAFEDGMAGIKNSVEWRDLISQRFDNSEPLAGSKEERLALFQTLRILHSQQARQLPKLAWKVPGTGERLYLLDHFQLRDYYGDLIGEIAESHHWPAHRVAVEFEARRLNPPTFLAPASWVVDALKVAFLLRTTDAADVDAQRAPWFLFALRNPEGISEMHWKFQAKLGQPVRTERGEIRLSSGSRFGKDDRAAWWLAYDAACMIDRELRDAQTLMRDANRAPFAATSVEHASSSEAFAKNVQTADWEPVNVSAKIGDVPKVIANLGGTKLYGDRPEFALRELIQNAADAVRALRALGGISKHEGEIEIALMPHGDVTWLQVTDSGIGMSRYVLTEVLLDFGNSLWSSESLRTELPGLAAKGFRAVGRFGIGFFAVFMLGQNVTVTTRRFSRTEDDQSDQWLLEFGHGFIGRPTLRRPAATEELSRPGTRVSVGIDRRTLNKLTSASFDPDDDRFALVGSYDRADDEMDAGQTVHANDLLNVVANLVPTLDVKVSFKVGGKRPVTVVNPDDWKKLKPARLMNRLKTGVFSKPAYTLAPLLETNGELLGRIAYIGGFYHAVVTHEGIRTGTVPKLGGVVLGHNNPDLARTTSRPRASREAWQYWAEKWIEKTNVGIEALIDLHPLCPAKDLPVYRMAGNDLTEEQLTHQLSLQREVPILIGIPGHEDYDDIGGQHFDQNFRVRPEFLILPKSDRQLTKALGIPSIDYRKRLAAVLRKVWGDFEEIEMENVCVGDIDGIEITRFVTRYERRPATSRRKRIRE